MVEYKDANEAERAVQLCNSGHDGGRARTICSAGSTKVGNDNAAGEYYLPDIVMIAERRRPHIRVVDRRRAVRDRRRQQPRRTGRARARMAAPPPRGRRSSRARRLIDPESVWFAADTELGRDVHDRAARRVRPRREDRRRRDASAPSSHIEGAIIAPGARSARSRGFGPAPMLGEGCQGRQFRRGQEGGRSGKGAKANHLSYIGDADGRREGQYRRRHDHLQLRRLRQISDRDRRGRLHRLEQRAGRAGHHRRRRDRRRGLGHHQGCRRPTSWRSRAASRRDSPAGPRASARGSRPRRTRSSMCGIVGIVGNAGGRAAAVRRAEAARISRL